MTSAYMWPWVALKEVQAPNGLAGGPFGSSLGTADYKASGIPVIRGNNLSGERRFTSSEFVFVDEAKAKRLSRNLAHPGDVVFTQRGTLGQVGIVPNGPYNTYVISQSQMKLTCDAAIAAPLYVYYAFRHPAVVSQIEAAAITSGVPHINLGLLGLIRIPLPPITVQMHIAEALGALDDKIELNRTMSGSIERLMRVLFASSFGAIDPERLPDGWMAGQLADHVDMARGLSYSGAGLADDGIPLHNLDSIADDGGYRYEGIKHYRGAYQPRHVVRAGDLLVVNTDLTWAFQRIAQPALVPQRFGDLSLFSHHLYRIRPKSGSWLTARFLYLALVSPRLRQVIVGYSNGTTVNMLPTDALQRPRLAVPPAELTQRFDETVQPLFAKQEHLQLESDTLAELRDLLLLKLMSGEIRLKDAEKAVAEAG